MEGLYLKRPKSVHKSGSPYIKKYRNVKVEYNRYIILYIYNTTTHRPRRPDCVLVRTRHY